MMIIINIKLLDYMNNEFESEIQHGKWSVFTINDYSILDEIKKLLFIKSKPNRK